MPEKDAPARRAAEQVARQSYGKLVAFLAARSHDVAAAEDALADAFAAALAHWPADGIPSAPESWLLVTARRRMIDTARRRRTRGEAADHLMLLAALSDRAQIIKIEQLDATIRFAMARFDQTLTPVGECALEFVLRKLPADERARGGRFPDPSTANP